MPDIPVCYAGSNAQASGTLTHVITIGSDFAGSYAFPTIQDECIIICGGAGTAIPTGIADSGGNPAYTFAGSIITSPASWIAYCPKAKPLHAAGTGFTADTITETYAATGAGKQGVVISVPGLTSTPLDSATVNTASGNSLTPSVSTAAALSQAREFIVAVCVHANGSTITWPNPWQPIATAQTGTGSYCSVAVRRNYSGTPTVTASPTLNGTAGAWTMTIAGFKGKAASLKSYVGSTVFDSTYSDVSTRWAASQEFDTHLGRSPCATRSGDFYYTEGNNPGSTAANDLKNMVSLVNSHPGFVPLALMKPLRDGATTGDTVEFNRMVTFITMVRNNGVPELHWNLWQECNYGGGHSSFGDGTTKHSETNDPWAVGGPVPPPSGGWTTDDAANHYHAYCNYYGPPLLVSGYLVCYKPITPSPKAMIVFFPGRAYGTGNYINNLGGVNEVLVDCYAWDQYNDSTKNLYTVDTLTRGTLNSYVSESITYDYSFSPPIALGLGETGVSDSSNSPDVNAPGWSAGFYTNNVSGAKIGTHLLPYPGVIPLFQQRIADGVDVGIINWYDAGAATGQNQCTADGKINGRTDIGNAYRALWDALSIDAGGSSTTISATAISCTTKIKAPTIITGGTTSLSPTAIPGDATLPTPTVVGNASTVSGLAIRPTTRIPIPAINQVAPTPPIVRIRPRTIFEAAFHSNPTTGDKVWNSLTDYIDLEEASISIQQRRTTVFDERSPGSLSFTVDNDGGEFTDDNTLSPFYPGVAYNTPIRVRMQYPASTNLLSDRVSNTDDVNAWVSEQGTLSTDTSSPAPGTNSSVVWATGVLNQTISHVMIGDGPWSQAGTEPIYVKAGEVYSASINVKADNTISCSLRLGWYDTNGNRVGFETSGINALTSSWKTLSILNRTAPVDGSLRISIVNETTVLPAVRSIDFSGSTSKARQDVTFLVLDFPDACQAGDGALAFIRLDDNNSTISSALASSGNSWIFKNSYPDSRGVTYLYEYTVTPSDLEGYSAFNLAASNDPGRIAGVVVTYSDVDQTTRIHKNAETTESVVRTTHTTPNVTTTVAGCRIVSAVFDVSSTTSKWTSPFGESPRETVFCIKGNAATGIVTDNGSNVAAGTYGSKVFTANSKSKYATMHTVALNPATGTGPGNVNVSIGTPMVVKGATVPAFSPGGTWHDIITAYADEWAPYWHLNHALVGVSATDRSKLLAGIEVDSAVSEVVMDLDPIAFYKLDESGSGGEITSTTCADSTENSQPPLAPVKRGNGNATGDNDPIQFGDGKGPGLDGTAALIVNPQDNANGYYLVAEDLNTHVGGVPGISVSFFWRSTYASTANTLTLLKISPVTASGITRSSIEFFGLPNNYIGVKASVTSDGGNFSCSTQISGQYFDGQTRQIGATLEMVGGNAVLTFYKNGKVAGTPDSHSTGITDVKHMNAISLGNSYPNSDRLCMGTYSNLAIYNSVLLDDDMLEIYNAGNNAFQGEAVTDRMYRVLDWEDVSGTDFDVSNIRCDRHMPDTTALLDVLQLIAATDGGTVYINGDDEIAFRSSATKEGNATPVLTISAGDLAAQPTATQNDSLLVNDMTVNRLGAGNSQRITDDSSIAQFGRHDKTIDTLVYSDSEATAMAGYFIAFYSEPKTRFDTIAVETLLLDDLTGVFAAIQQMWAVIQVTDMPSTSPIAILSSYVEGFEWDISNDSWLVTFDVSPIIPFAVLSNAGRDVMGNVVVAR